MRVVGRAHVCGLWYVYVITPATSPQRLGPVRAQQMLGGVSWPVAKQTLTRVLLHLLTTVHHRDERRDTEVASAVGKALVDTFSDLRDASPEILFDATTVVLDTINAVVRAHSAVFYTSGVANGDEGGDERDACEEDDEEAWGDDLPIVWERLPSLGKQGEATVAACMWHVYLCRALAAAQQLLSGVHDDVLQAVLPHGPHRWGVCVCVTQCVFVCLCWEGWGFDVVVDLGGELSPSVRAGAFVCEWLFRRPVLVHGGGVCCESCGMWCCLRNCCDPRHAPVQHFAVTIGW